VTETKITVFEMNKDACAWSKWQNSQEEPFDDDHRSPSLLLYLPCNIPYHKKHHDFSSDDFPGTVTAFLLFKVETDFPEVPPQSQGWAVNFQEIFHLESPAAAGCQVLQLFMEINVEFIQEGHVPDSRGVYCVKQVGTLLEYQVEHRYGMGLLELIAIHHLLGELEVSLILQTPNKDILLIWSNRSKVFLLDRVLR
jgi:hypothetical protein